MASAKSSRTRCSVPHSAGGLTPAGGGMYLPIVRKTWPIKLSGVQFTSPIVPPGRQTRSSSCAACSWLGVNITPKTESTTSNELSANGNCSASRSEEHTSELQSRQYLVCRLLLEKKKYIFLLRLLAPY